MPLSKIQDTSRCPHCGATLYGAYVSKCYKCGKEVEVAKQTDELYEKYHNNEITKLANSPRFKIKYYSVWRAFRKDAATLFETYGSGGSGGPGYSVNYYKVMGIYSGEEGWRYFAKVKIDKARVARLKCAFCAHSHLIKVPLGGISDKFSCDWFEIIALSGPVGNYKAGVICKNCGKQGPCYLRFY